MGLNSAFEGLIIFPFSKIVQFVRCGKILLNGAGHRRQYGACAFYAVFPRIQTQTHNM